VKRLIIAAILLAAATALSAQTTATIRDLKGKVEVKPLGKNWILAKDGMVVDTLATISTGFDSSATLLIGKNKVGIAPLTRLTVDKIVEKAGKLDTSLHLRVGKVSAEVKSSTGEAQDFKVTSPYSTASVRGTKFDYDGFLVRVADGTVAFIPGKPNRDIVVFAPRKNAAAAGTGAPTGDTPPADGDAPPSEGGDASPDQAAEDAEYEAFLADLLVQIQEQFPDENFDIVADEPDAATPASTPDASLPGTPGETPPAPTQAPAVYVEKGASAVITQDFSIIQVVGGKISPTPMKITTTNAAGQSTTTTVATPTTTGEGTTTPADTTTTTSTDESGGTDPSTPPVTPPPAPTTGTIILTWQGKEREP